MLSRLIVSIFVVDSLKISRILKSRGYSDQQAEGITEVLQSLDASNLATKADLKEVEHKIETVEHRLVNKITSMENKLTVRFCTMMMASVAFLTVIKFFA